MSTRKSWGWWGSLQRSSDAVKRIDTIIDGVIRSLQSEDGGDRKRTAEKLGS